MQLVFTDQLKDLYRDHLGRTIGYAGMVLVENINLEAAVKAVGDLQEIKRSLLHLTGDIEHTPFVNAANAAIKRERMSAGLATLRLACALGLERDVVAGLVETDDGLDESVVAELSMLPYVFSAAAGYDVNAASALGLYVRYVASMTSYKGPVLEEKVNPLLVRSSLELLAGYEQDLDRINGADQQMRHSVLQQAKATAYTLAQALGLDGDCLGVEDIVQDEKLDAGLLHDLQSPAGVLLLTYEVQAGK